jgi:hypothetical protein
MIAFYEPKYKPEEDMFGAATLGFAGKPTNKGDAICQFPISLQGIRLNGSYQEILSKIPEKEYKLAIVLLGNTGGENVFVLELSKKLNCPIIGGGAAMDGERGGLIAGAGQVSVLLIDDQNYDVQIEMKNIHTHVLGTCKVDFDDPRVIKTIDGMEPALWLKNQKEILGIDETDFEHFTLSDKAGVNAHLSMNGNLIVSGRDLESEMLIRYVKPEEVYESVYSFYNDEEDAIIFGCAGLKAITGEITPIKSLGLYLFGEICMAEDRAVFGNLMLSKVRLHKVK